MRESIVFCITCTMLSLKKFTFAVSSSDELLVGFSTNSTKMRKKSVYKYATLDDEKLTSFP